MRLNLLLVRSFNSSQTYRSHTCTLVRERRWSCFCQFGPQEMWSTGWGMSRNLWRSRWGITLTAHSESTQRSVVLCCPPLFCLFSVLSVRQIAVVLILSDLFVLSWPSATSCRVGVILAWPSGDRWLSGLLDCWGVWGFGAGRLGRPPSSSTTDTGRNSGSDKITNIHSCKKYVFFFYICTHSNVHDPSGYSCL